MKISPRRRFWVWVVCVAGILLGMPLWFLLLRGRRILDSDAILFSGWIVLSVLILMFWWLLRTTPPDAIKLSSTRSQWIIVLGAIWLHAHAIVWLAPGLSDDALRYRSDGYMWATPLSPYRYAPDSEQLKLDIGMYISRDDLDERVPYPNVATVYLPTSQLVFAAIRKAENVLIGLTKIRHDAAIGWRNYLFELSFTQRLLIWRLSFGAMMLVATWLLVRCCLSMGRSAWWAVLIGWHPLTIVETSGMAHQDAIGVMLLSGAFGMLLCQRFPCLVGVLLALACGVKPLAMIPVAFYFIAKPDRRWIIPFVVTLLALSSFFFYQDGYIGFLQTLKTYTQKWEANGSFFHIIRTQCPPLWPLGELFIEPWEYARMIGAIIICSLAIGLIWKRAHWTTSVYWLVLVSLLVAPVVYPWYLLWLLVIIPIISPRWGLTGLIFAATVTINYRLWHTPDWVLPWSWLAMEYVPVYLALGVEIFIMRPKPAPPCPTPPICRPHP